MKIHRFFKNSVYWKDRYKALYGKRLYLGMSLILDGYSSNGDVRMGCVARMKPNKEYIYVIYIHPGLKWKEKLMVLAHEYGHISRWMDGNLMVKGTGAYSEDEANRNAIEILKQFDVDSNTYMTFYNDCSKWRKKNI